MFLLLTVASLTLGFTTATTSVALAMALISFSTFIGGGFQMVALKVGSYAFPRERAAMMTGIASGSWSLVNFLLLRAIGPWTGWMNGGRWEEIFWLIAVLPVAGIALWFVLTWNEKPSTATA
jgi:MFS family permease